MIFASLGSMFIHLYPIYNQHIIWLSSLFGKKKQGPQLEFAAWGLRTLGSTDLLASHFLLPKSEICGQNPILCVLKPHFSVCQSGAWLMRICQRPLAQTGGRCVDIVVLATCFLGTTGDLNSNFCVTSCLLFVS